MATNGVQKRKRTTEDMEFELMNDVEFETYKKRNKITSMEPEYKSLVLEDPLRLCVENVEIYFTDFHFYQTKILKNFYKKVTGSRDVDELFCSQVLETIILDRKDEDPKLDERRRHQLFPSKRFKMSYNDTLEIQVMVSPKVVGWMTFREVNSLRSAGMKKVIDYVEDDARSDLEKATVRELKWWYSMKKKAESTEKILLSK